MPETLKLYHAAPSRSSVVHWMLEEVGEPFEIEMVSIQDGANKRPEFLQLNPLGKVPVLAHGDVVISEVAAICCYLADAFPAAGLAPTIDDPSRGTYLKWMFFGPSVFEPAVLERTFGVSFDDRRGQTGWGRLDDVLDVIDAGLAPGPYLLGNQFTAADVVIGSGLGWTLMFDMIPMRPSFQAYVERLDQRPAHIRSRARDEGLRAAAD